MDPLTQAALGAAAGAALARPGSVRLALLVGASAGAAPDIDVLIRSEADPLLGLEYHRHFTHALAVAPLIGLLVAGLFRLVLWRRGPGCGELAAYGIAGALTHGFLDACTSYGTLLYWPFSRHRESWELISIIDPLFTLPLLMLLGLALARRRPVFARVALVVCLAYLGLGLVQRERAERFAGELAEARSHAATELTARPSLGNLLLWRLVYRDGERYYVDAVWLGPFGGSRLYPGDSVAAFTREAAVAVSGGAPVQLRDIERFRFFSQGYLYRHPSEPRVIGDLRYAIFPDSVIPLWGIRHREPGRDGHVGLEYFRTVERGAFARLFSMILGKEAAPLQKR